MQGGAGLLPRGAALEGGGGREPPLSGPGLVWGPPSPGGGPSS